jgi:hypothetical protein
MSNKYLEMKERHRKEVNEFPMKWAFNEYQLNQGLKELGVEKKDVVSIGLGGFIRKSDAPAHKEMWERLAKEREDSFKDAEYAYQAFLYELANHEYCYTYNVRETLESLGLTEDEVKESPMLESALKRAIADYMSSVEF